MGDVKFRIRPGKIEDISQIVSLYIEGFHHSFPFFLKHIQHWLTCHMLNTVLMKRNSVPIQVYVLTLHDKIVGTVKVQYDDDDGHGYISNLVVDSGSRRKGFGQMLLRQCEKAAKRRRLKYLYLHVKSLNIPGQKLYEKHGYTRTHDNPDLFGRLLYVKHL
jgi:ribosomal protein S18 acetylase RimI-like enzyme